MTKKKTREGNTLSHNLLTVAGTILCILLIPILAVNCTLLVKGYTNSQEVPSVGGIFPMIVLTDSMYPEFASGDLIICKTAEAGEIQVGDVISFFDPAGNGTSVVTHRVMEITAKEGNTEFITKGDANNTEDEMTVTEENLIGTYTGIRIRGAGNVAMFMQTTTGLIVCVILPLILLLGYDAVRRKLYSRQHAEEKEELLAELEELRKLKAAQEKEN